MHISYLTHTADNDNNSNLLNFLDADLAVLRNQSAADDHYAALIREDYQHVPHDTYCEKGAGILESFLGEGRDGDGGEIEDGTATTSSSGATTTIFRTLAMQKLFEKKVIANLRREIDTIRKGVIPSLSLL